MAKLRSFIKYWVPVLVWLAPIFAASSDSGSFGHSSRLIAPLVRWLFPHVTEETVHAVVVFVRKCAHVTEFGILALLLWRALRKPDRNNRRPWYWSHALLTVALVMLYAASDEFHQRFVPSRDASVMDVMIDTGGAVLALFLVWCIGRWRRRW